MLYGTFKIEKVERRETGMQMPVRKQNKTIKKWGRVKG